MQDFTEASGDFKIQESIIWKEGVLRKVGHIVLNFARTASNDKDFLKSIPAKMTYNMTELEEQSEAREHGEEEKEEPENKALSNDKLKAITHDWTKIKYRYAI